MSEYANNPLDLTEDSRILIRSNNWIGDVVLSSPALHALRTAFPRAFIAVLAKPWVIPALRYNPHIDQIIVYDAQGRHNGFAGLNRLASDLRQEDFHAAILFQRAFEAAWLSFWARIPRRAGFRTDGRSLLLTHRVLTRKEDFQIHRVKHNLLMLERLGIPEVDNGLVLRVGRGQADRSLKILAELGIGSEALLFGLCPGATYGTAKRWSPDRFALLADRLTSHYGAHGLIFGSADEHELGNEICSLASGSGIHNLAGHTSLGEAMGLIGLCGLFVTNDTGLMHIAAASDVPLVAIFGPTEPGTTSPWCHRKTLLQQEGISCAPCMERTCKEEIHRCMEAISVDHVFETSLDLLSRFGRSTIEERRQALLVSDKPTRILEFD